MTDEQREPQVGPREPCEGWSCGTMMDKMVGRQGCGCTEMMSQMASREGKGGCAEMMSQMMSKMTAAFGVN